MQTFLPLPNFYDSLKTLDPSRLGNQIYREALTIIRGGWSNHPASKMWQGHLGALCIYGLVGLEILRKRNKPYPHWENVFRMYAGKFRYQMQLPFWFGNEKFHSTHRAALLAKNYSWYSQFNWKEEPIIKYWWPVCQH